MRAVVFSIFFASAVLVSNSTRGADLQLPIKPPVQSAKSSPEEQHRQLFEKFLQFLRERDSH
jgi:hypothetical protein